MEAAVDQLSTLGHPQRLAVFRLLVRRYPGAVPAGEIAEALGLKPSTFSTYLAALRGAGLIAQARRGTSLLYRADMDGAGALVSFLFADCCRGRPDLCQPLAAVPLGAPTMDTAKPAVLFICTGNSARSIFAEAILRAEAGDRFTAFSAGTQPRSALNPVAVDLLRAKGYDVSCLRAKHVSEFQGADAPRLDFVFTVCDRAANEDCPAWPGQPITGHWGTPDPVKAEGTEAERALAFQRAYAELRNRILPFVALRLRGMSRAAIQSEVDDIGRALEPR
jgi:protein-tyrosine-phosphatase/DNA-binding transcriptional ArsR family regulator